jgi:hypothetical protein
MKGTFIQKGLVVKGLLANLTGYFHLERWLRETLVKFHVPVSDSCCPNNSGSVSPVSTDDEGALQYWNGTSWTTVTGIDVDGGVTSNSMYASFYPTNAPQNIVAGAGGAISVATYVTSINTDADADAFTLADGTVVGQMKKIRLVVDGGGNGVVTPATPFFGGAVTSTFDDAGDYILLMWNGTAWVLLENSGTIIA